MKDKLKGNADIQEGLKIYQKAFRIPENLCYYSKEDLSHKEKKFVKYCFICEKNEIFIPNHPVPQ